MLEQRDKGCPWTTTLLESLLSLLAAGRHLCWCWGGKLGQEDVGLGRSSAAGLVKGPPVPDGLGVPGAADHHAWA